MESLSLRSLPFPIPRDLSVYSILRYSFQFSSYPFSFSSQNCCFNSNRVSARETGTTNLGVRWAPFKSSNFASKSQNLSAQNAAVGESSSGVGHRDAVIIVDHGSRRRESNLMLNEFVDMFRRKTGYEIVEPAHMELAEPSIRDAFQSCVEQGASRVIISPFFLSPGRHWSQDIPSLSAEAAKEHPGVSYIVTAPLGLHELLVDVVNDRIKHCMKHVDGDADECSVCVGTGKCKLYNSCN